MRLKDFSWDKIPPKQVTQAAPVAGAPPGFASLTVPAGKRWLVVGIFTKCVMDGNAADRRLSMYATDGTNTVMNTPYSTATIASKTGYFNFGPLVTTVLQAIVGTNYFNNIPFAQLPTELPAGYILKVDMASIQAGDQFDVTRVMLKEAPA